MNKITCYLCNCELNHENTSVEHIIPEALGGKLTSDKLLCKLCNSKFGTEIDSIFIESFEPIICTLDLIGRKKNTYSVDCDILLEDKVIKGIMCNDKLQPKNPFHVRVGKNVIFYGSKRILSNYKDVIIKEAENEGILSSELNIKIIEDINANFKTEFKLNNENLQQALTKIAVNFAIYSGISKNTLNHLINSDTQKITNGSIVPYIPLTDFEKAIEKTRVSIDSNYPNHSIILFTENLLNKKKRLICFIELFSTFQYFVILSNEYAGEDIFKTYWQKLLKEQISEYEIDENELYSKHILPDLAELKSRVPSINIRDYDVKKLKKILETYLSQPKPYVGDYSSHLEKLFNGISMPLVYCSDPIKFKSFEKVVSNQTISKLSGGSSKFYMNCLFQMGQLYFTFRDDEADIVLEKNFRRVAESDSSIVPIFSVLTPKFVHMNWRSFQKYGSEKFNDFTEFRSKLFLEKKKKMYDL